MITDQRADEAFEYLRDTTSAIGAAKAELERSEILRKRTRRRMFLGAPDGPIAQREAFAEVQDETSAADERYVEAVGAFETLRARRDVETIALDVWRTESANRRRA
jgi:hypothetical protein